MVLRRWSSAALVVCASLALTACADETAGEDGNDAGLVTVEVLETYPAALAEGVLTSAPGGERTCWTVTTEDGRDRYVLVLPVGSEMSDGKLRITGSASWLSDGDEVQVGGGEWSDAAYEEYVGLCGGTGLWLVSPGDAAS